MLDPERPIRFINEAVELRPETVDEARRLAELSPVHMVRWVQCYRCRRRFWYAVLRDTDPVELQQLGMGFRQRLHGERCDRHPAW